MLTKNVAVFVMDIGCSHKNQDHVLGNQSEMISFNKDRNISLNPFSTLSSNGTLYAKALELIKKGHELQEITKITGL